ncbi:MAG: hypothetical protein K2Q17_01815 [Nitrospiraceae bacterium]|jgi:hypothetical protein|nr:hypothetical protein [Nitrospiraceae bacterium]OQW66006.1 MAG: hypothetical protein BVN29_05825 [Nitrospira sp. ST-bin5]
MTPEELCRLHPELFHVSAPDAWPMMKKYGLLSTANILDLLGIDQKEERERLLKQRRPFPVPLCHPTKGTIIINDNKPLSEKALSQILDDNLTPEDWLMMLNSRIFFWSNGQATQRLLQARINRGRKRLVLVVDTQKLARDYLNNMEISPINSGSTIRKAARRGLQTFTPLGDLPYREWQKLRGHNDKILEVIVRDSIPNIQKYVLRHHVTSGDKDPEILMM